MVSKKQDKWNTSPVSKRRAREYTFPTEQKYCPSGEKCNIWIGTDGLKKSTHYQY